MRWFLIALTELGTSWMLISAIMILVETVLASPTLAFIPTSDITTSTQSSNSTSQVSKPNHDMKKSLTYLSQKVVQLIVPRGASEQGHLPFEPSILTVKVGDKITVMNNDHIPHSVTSGTGPEDANSGIFFDSSMIEGGKSSIIVTANLAPGDYGFFCIIHPFMKGKVQVLANSLTGSAQSDVVGTELLAHKNILNNLSKPSISQSDVVESQPPITNESTSVLSQRDFTTSTIRIMPGSSDAAISKFYEPDPLSIFTGTTVIWNNDDDTLHTVTSGSPEGGGSLGTEFDSGYLDAGMRFQHEFKSAGTFDYWCTLHPHMTGKVVVR